MNCVSFPCSQLAWLFITLQTKFKNFSKTYMALWDLSFSHFSLICYSTCSSCFSHIGSAVLLTHKHMLSLSSFHFLFPLPRVLYSQIFVWFVLTLSLCLNITPLCYFSLTYLNYYLTSVTFIFCNTYYLTL